MINCWGYLLRSVALKDSVGSDVQKLSRACVSQQRYVIDKSALLLALCMQCAIYLPDNLLEETWLFVRR